MTMTDVPLIPFVPMGGDQYHRAVGPLFSSIAHDIDDGWFEMQATGARLRELQTTVDAAGTPEPDPQAIAAAFLSDPDGVDILEQATTQVTEMRAANEASRLAGMVVRSAQALLAEQAKAWIRNHEVEICDQLSRHREGLAERMRALAPTLEGIDTAADLSVRPTAAPDYAKAVALIKDWDHARSVHLAVTGIRSDERSNLWHGLDWVSDYDKAWPEFFLIRGIEAHDTGRGHVSERDEERAPWVARRVPGMKDVWDDVTEPTIRARQIAQLEVWTPTAAQFAREKARMDRALLTAKKSHIDGLLSTPQPVVTVRPGADFIITA